MIKLDQKADILMKYFRENMSQRAIAKEMKVSRTTVRKYIKDYETKCEKVEELANKLAEEEYLKSFKDDDIVFIFEYSDNDGSLGCAMEFGGLFNNVKHISISHH